MGVETGTGPGPTGSAPDGAGVPGPARYDERLRVPWLWHLWAAGFAGICGAYAAAYVDPAAGQAAVYLATFALLEALMWGGGRARVTVTGDGTLAAGVIALPGALVDDVDPLDDVRRALVPGSPAQTRAWVRSGVRIRTLDGYTVVVSSRHPAELAAALGRPAA